MDAEEPAARGTAAFKFEAHRLSQTDRIVGTATLALLVSLFLSWFGVSIAGIHIGVTNGLYHSYMYLTLLIALALLAYYVAKAGWEVLPVKLPRPEAELIVLATGINLVLTVISFLTKPTFTTWDIGAYVGLVASVIAAAPRIVPALASRQAAARRRT